MFKPRILLVLLLLLSAAAMLQAASTKTYSIPLAQVHYQLLPDGRALVSERITYQLHGTFHQLYLDKPANLTIANESGHCEGADCRFSFAPNYNGWQELQLNGNFADQPVVAEFDYEVDGQVLAQKDTAQFFEKL